MNVRLVDLPLPVVVALRDGDVDTAAELIGLNIPDDFAAMNDVWTFMSELLSDPRNRGWTMNAIVLDDVIVGNAGFKGAPNAEGEVEMGYTVLEEHRRQGLAVAAARLLLDRMIPDPSVTRVITTIRPDNAASIAVSVSAGFAPAGDRIHERWGRQLVFRHDLRQHAVNE
jgi:RimJ/RimL family protein N-acetyltransferase